MVPCLWLVLALVGPVVGTPAAGVGSTEAAVCPPSTSAVALEAADTLPSPAVEYGDWYARRLAIHRVASYTMVPLFAAQYAAGSRLYADPGLAADHWARRAHRPLAVGVGTLFLVNTVTGGWNLWEARKDPEERRRRTAHALLMLAADAGFAATGVLGSRAATEGEGRALHRGVALGSMATALAGYAVMLPQLWRD